ncbi:MAG TPA: sulfotransferase [Anaerolineae bacterium]|nr:sulfotransferase [Anaerolineae bacterium]
MTSATCAPILIVGCRRSGTTLLRNLLNQHPDLLVHPDEPQFLLEIRERFGDPVRPLDEALAYLLAHPYLPKFITKTMLENAFRGQDECPFSQFLARYLQVFQTSQQYKQRIVLKDPSLVFHLDTIHQILPDVHIVHIVRDARANVSSQRARWPNASVWECACWWRNAVRSARYWKEQTLTPFTELTYEDLTSQPEETMRQLCKSLSIAFTPDLLTVRYNQVIYTPNQKPQKVSFNSFDTARLTLWQERLSPLDVALIELCCAREMDWWHYPLQNPSIPTAQLQRRLWRERIHYFLLRNGRSLKYFLRKIGWRFGFHRSKIPPKN